MEDPGSAALWGTSAQSRGTWRCFREREMGVAGAGWGFWRRTGEALPWAHWW